MITFMGSLSSSELLIILLIILLIFGGAKLPKLARSLGQAQKEFKTGLSESQSDENASDKGASDKGASDKASDA